ncbi:MAG: ArsR/SmtB family transcription factor [Eubacteriales bacterium]
MTEPKDEIQKLADEFRQCRSLLLALGDENRQHLLLTMMQMGECGGVRVGAITAKTNLSRPAVSHHLKILRDTGLIRLRREGTKNYYSFDPDSHALERLVQMFRSAEKILNTLSEQNQSRSGMEPTYLQEEAQNEPS